MCVRVENNLMALCRVEAQEQSYKHLMQYPRRLLILGEGEGTSTGYYGNIEYSTPSDSKCGEKGSEMSRGYYGEHITLVSICSYYGTKIALSLVAVVVGVWDKAVDYCQR